MPAHIPVQVMRVNNKASVINPDLILHPQQAIDQYRLKGGSITDPEQHIQDPLFDDPSKMDIRLVSFNKRFPSIDAIFHGVVNGNATMFIDALKFFIDVTFRLSHS